MTTCPIAHAFEYDGTRITGIRFRLDDGREVVIPTLAAIVDPPVDRRDELAEFYQTTMGAAEDWVAERAR